MARGVNKVILVGNVGGDPETRYMPNGNAVTNITLATSESWKDKQTGQQQERTEWHRVVFFGPLLRRRRLPPAAKERVKERLPLPHSLLMTTPTTFRSSGHLGDN